MPLIDRQDERADGADAGAFGRRADAEPDRAEHAGDQQDHQQRAEQHGADRLLVDRRRHGGRGADIGADRAGRQRPAAFADQFGLQDGRDHDIDDHAGGGEQARDHAGEKHLADRNFGEHAPHDHQHRGRDQHAQAGAAGDRAEREIAPVAVAAHFRIGDARERRRRGDAHAGDEAEQRIAEDGRDREPAGQPAAQPVGERIDVARGAAFGEQVAHQHEQRDHREHVVAQRFIGGIGDEIAHHLHVALHEIDAERGRDAERDRDVHAGEHQRRAPPRR